LDYSGFRNIVGYANKALTGHDCPPGHLIESYADPLMALTVNDAVVRA